MHVSFKYEISAVVFVSNTWTCMYAAIGISHLKNASIKCVRCDGLRRL
jgi:hypothetical protein